MVDELAMKIALDKLSLSLSDAQPEDQRMEDDWRKAIRWIYGSQEFVWSACADNEFWYLSQVASGEIW
jgi:hypothetical protein